MVSGRGDGSATSRRLTLPQLTSYDRLRKSHALRTGVDTKSVHFDWLSKELECGICEKTIQNTMVVRNCMHRFCADCILQRIHTGTRKCPSCQKVLPKKTPLKSDANFDAIINKFTLSMEKKSMKRPITETSNFCFTKKRRLFDKKSSSKRLIDSDSVPSSSSLAQTSLKDVKVSCDSMVDSAISTSLEIKPPLLPSTHSDTSDPPLTIDESSSDDAYPNLQHPTTSSPIKDGNSTDADEKRNKFNRSTVNQYELTPVIVIQKSSNHERINGIPAKSSQANGKGERSAKYSAVHLNPSSSTHSASKQVDSKSNIATASVFGTSNGNVHHVNGNVSKISDGLLLPPLFGSGSSVEDAVTSPHSPEYQLMSAKQRLSSGIESELVLNPDASVINDDSLPIAAKHLRYIVTCPATTVGHLCEFILQRIRIESPTERDRKCAETYIHKRVLLCPVKSDLALDDVLVVNETSEGQFTTMNVGERNADPQSTSIFTINSPFSDSGLEGNVSKLQKNESFLYQTALDESITVEQLKAEYWANRKRPLKLIFKFTGNS